MDRESIDFDTAARYWAVGGGGWKWKRIIENSVLDQLKAWIRSRQCLLKGGEVPPEALQHAPARRRNSNMFEQAVSSRPILVDTEEERKRAGF